MIRQADAMGTEDAEMRVHYAQGNERDRLGDPKGVVEFEPPPEPRLRAPTLGDVAAVTTLLNRVAGTDESGWIDEEALRGWFTNPHFPIAEDAVLVERQGEVVAYADVYRGGEAKEKVWGDLRVPAEERDGEVLPLLVDWMEERAGPARFRLQFPDHADEVRAELKRRGYAPVRYSFEMERDLDVEPPAPEWPQGISVRTLREGEEERLYEVDTEAFADHWDFTETPFDEWRHWHMENHFDPTCWFVAEDDAEIAGIAICSSEREGRPGVGWVDTLAVRRPWRRRGLGLALLLHSFREFRSRGRERVGLGVDGENTTGAVRLYERAGMHVARRSDTYERPSA
jgi:mycothiol synthase